MRFIIEFFFIFLKRFLEKAPFLGVLIRVLIKYFFMLLIRFFDKALLILEKAL